MVVRGVNVTTNDFYASTSICQLKSRRLHSDATNTFEIGSQLHTTHVHDSSSKQTSSKENAEVLLCTVTKNTDFASCYSVPRHPFHTSTTTNIKCLPTQQSAPYRFGTMLTYITHADPEWKLRLLQKSSLLLQVLAIQPSEAPGLA